MFVHFFNNFLCNISIIYISIFFFLILFYLLYIFIICVYHFFISYFSKFFLIFKTCQKSFVFRKFSFIMCALLLLPDESTYYLFSLFFDIYMFFYLFLFKIFFEFFLYIVFCLIIYFFYFFSYLFFNKIFIIFFLCFFFIFIFFLDLFIFFVLFLCMNLFSILFYKLFQVPIAGLIFLSRDFVSIEEEDLWVSSNLFFLDFKIIQAEKLKEKLKIQEIDVFFTLVTLFFSNDQKFNFNYLSYINDLNFIRAKQDLRKKSLPDDSKTNLSNLLTLVRSGQDFENLQFKILESKNKTIFNFYKKFFKSVFLYNESFHLRKKKKILKQKLIKNRSLYLYKINRNKMLHSTQTHKSYLQNSRIILNNKYLVNDLILSKIFQVYEKNPVQNNFLLKNLSSRQRINSNFLNFFWFSFPFYVFRANYLLFFFSSLFSFRTFYLQIKYFSFLVLQKLYFFFIPTNDFGNEKFKSFFNFRNFSVSSLKDSDFTFSRLFKVALSLLFINITDEDFSLNSLYDKTLDQKNSKKRRYIKQEQSRLFRKPNTVIFDRLSKHNNTIFLNQYALNVYKKYPNLKILDLYKLLEYFYFVITNDSDFYENVTFASKVAVLKDKYGQAIVNDLLSSHDHKQAKNLILKTSQEYNSRTVKFSNSKNLHYEEESEKKLQDEIFFEEDFDLADKKKIFKYKKIPFSPNISNFSKNLLLSYRYRFRV